MIDLRDLVATLLAFTVAATEHRLPLQKRGWDPRVDCTETVQHCLTEASKGFSPIYDAVWSMSSHLLQEVCAYFSLSRN